MLKIQVEKITGLADENHTSSVFSKRIVVSGDLSGTLVGCVMTKNGDFTDLPTMLHRLFEIIAEKIEGTEEIIGDRILEALTAAKSYVLEQGLEASFATCFFYQKACFIVRLGDKVKVWTYKAGKSKELGFEYGSGPSAPGQFFVLGTEKFFTTFDTSALLTGDGLDLEEIIDGLATDISSDEKQSEIGVAFVKIGADDEKITERVENFEVNQIEEGQIDSVQVREDLVAPEVQARDEVDSQIVGASEDAVWKKRKFSIGNSVGRIIGIIFTEISKLKRGDIRAIFRLRRNLVMAAILLLVILVGSAIFTINNQKQAGKTVEFKKQLESARSNLIEGESIISLNYEKARGKLVEADSDINKALALFPKDSEATQLKSEIDKKLKETENVSGLPFGEVVDVGDNLVSVAVSKSGLVGFSKDKAYDVSLDGKVTKNVDTQQGALAGFVWDDTAFTLSGDKVVKIGLGTQKREEIVSLDFGRDIAVFLGNVYVLAGGQIIKFVPVEKGYGDGQNYLEKKEDFSDYSRLAIDGSIWVTQNSQILKYNRGKKEDFSIQGLVQTDVSFGEIYTNSDIDRLYVIDRLNGALLVIGKDGVYQRVYQSVEFKNNPTFVVDEAQGKVYIASGSKIMEAGL